MAIESINFMLFFITLGVIWIHDSDQQKKKDEYET